MGEIADMMLDGTLCESCGVYLDGNSPDHPRKCSACQKDEKLEKEKEANLLKVPCPCCEKRVKAAGLYQHIQTVHGMKKSAQAEVVIHSYLTDINYFRANKTK
jgi:hypothetical protein